MQLFEVEELTWEKVASIELEEDATQWPRQVLTELFRALPEISEYTPEVKFIKTNEEQGYAVGVVVVSNGTNSALAATNTGTETPRALVPVVIKNGKLSPLDTLMSSSGRMFPLTVDRLREVLYRPETFDLITDDWGEAGLWQLFAPPGQNQMGGQMGGQGPQVLTGPGMKQASLLERIDGTILQADIDQLAYKLWSDDVLVKTATQNPAMQQVLRKLSMAHTVSGDVDALTKRALDEHFPADVVLMRYVDEGDCYEVKLANRASGRESTEFYHRGDFLRFTDAKVAERIDKEGPVVGAKSDNHARVLVGVGGMKVKPIEHSGYYTVYNAITGAQLRGWVFTGLLDATGSRLPLSLFASEVGATTQEEIAGSYAADHTMLPHDPIKGQGCFVVGSSGLSMHATVPLTVRGSSGEQGSIRYNCVDVTGDEILVVLQRGMDAVVAFPDRKELVMPYHTSFISTEHPMPPLISRGEEVEKVASSLLTGRLTITGVPEEEAYRFHLKQLPHLSEKVAMSTGPVMLHDDALYTLCMAGLGVEEALGALGKVAQVGRCEVVCTDVGVLPQVPDLEKFASHSTEIRSIRPNLVKEAATLTDSMTVDAVLGLDFINSENVRVFISMIPYLEKALNKTCELIFASRLGLSEIPETAAARAARGLNDAIRGLKALALRQIDELP